MPRHARVLTCMPARYGVAQSAVTR